MTKNNRFKHEARAYQKLFGVTYMQALSAVSVPIIVTPEMEMLAELVVKQFLTYSPDANEHTGGMVLITGSVGAGRTYLQHYLVRKLASIDGRVIEVDDENHELQRHIIPSFQEADDLPIFLVDQEAWPLSPEGMRQLRRMVPDTLSMPELRTQAQCQLALGAVAQGTGLISNIHTSGPSDALGRFLALSGGAPETKALLRREVKMVIDVSRLRAGGFGGKSIPVLSHYEVTPELWDAWEAGRLGSYLRDIGFVSADSKTTAQA